MRRILRFSSISVFALLSAAVVWSCQQRAPKDILQTTFKGLEASRHCVTWQQGKRCYYLVIPNADNNKKSLLLALHPAFHDVEALEELSGLVRPVAAAGIVAIYPEGIEKQWNDGRVAKESKTYRENTDDVGFLSLIVSDVQARLGIAPQNTTIAGMSNGGMMALRMACESGVAKKILAVVAHLPLGMEQTCQPSIASMVLVFGTEDDVVPYRGGNLSRVAEDWGTVESAEKTEQVFAKFMGCAKGFAAYSKDNVEDGTIIHKRDYRCSKNSLQSYHIEGMGHTWPGESNVVQAFLTTRGRISKELDANTLLIDTALKQ